MDEYLCKVIDQRNKDQATVEWLKSLQVKLVPVEWTGNLVISNRYLRLLGRKRSWR